MLRPNKKSIFWFYRLIRSLSGPLWGFNITNNLQLVTWFILLLLISGVVHLSGGTAAFIAALLLGPRKGRYDKNQKRVGAGAPTNIILGTFVLWYVWACINFVMSYRVKPSPCGPLCIGDHVNTPMSALHISTVFYAVEF